MTATTQHIALVTGATRGIGAAIAQTLAASGMAVIGTATSDEGAQKISAALAAWPGCKGVTLDVRDGAACEALWARTSRLQAEGSSPQPVRPLGANAYRPAFSIRASNLPPRSSTYRLASASAAGQYCMGEAI